MNDPEPPRVVWGSPDPDPVPTIPPWAASEWYRSQFTTLEAIARFERQRSQRLEQRLARQADWTVWIVTTLVLLATLALAAVYRLGACQ